MNPLVLRQLVWIACLMATGAAFAQPATDSERYSPAPESSSGIGKCYTGREIPASMGWQGTVWLEREERSDLRLAALSLRPGSRMSDAQIRRDAAEFALE